MYSAVEYQPVAKFYAYFTLAIAALFLGFYLFEDQIHWWSPTSPKILPLALSGYFALALRNIYNLYRHYQVMLDQFLPSVMADILFFGYLLLYLAPFQDDLSILLLITVGLGNFLVTKRYGYLLAAMATIMVLSNWFLFPHYSTDAIFSGTFLSVLYFGEAFIVQTIRDRLSEAKTHVETTQSLLTSASKINDLIIERMQTGVCVASNSGVIISINRAAKERLGSVSHLPPEVFERLQEWHEFGVQNDNTLQMAFLDGGRVNILVSFAQIDERTTLIFVEDKDTVARRANQFKMASLARMAASIAHEIRNPLSAISHASQLLVESPNLDADDEHLCHIIVEHCKRMDTIIQNVLQISRRNSSDPQRLDLSPWLNQFKEEFEQRHKLPIQIEGESHFIRFDPSQFQQVLWNLCSNAMQYGRVDEEHPILFQVQSLGQRISLKVIDHGDGVPEAELPFLFEPFHTTSPKGTGLGLYLIKELCEANNAEIRYHNTLQYGACFEIVFAPDFQNNKVSQ